MSTDSILDQLTNVFYNFFVYKLPMFFLPFLLNIYTSIQNYYSYFCLFFKNIYNGIRDSLNTKYLAFFRISDVDYFPYIIYPNSKFSDEPQWIYDCDQKLFSLLSFGHHVSLSHLPFIGASLNHISESQSEVIGDLSEWIMEQRINSSDSAIPLQIMVAAWNYCTNNTLTVHFKDMYLTVITEDGEEHTYSLETEEEIINNSDEDAKEESDKIELPQESPEQVTNELKED